jgi:hypothetical protein
MKAFIHLRSARFLELPGEAGEMVNPGTVGKALALHLQQRLQAMGRQAPFLCCEDWGWWVELADAPFRFGVCIYSLPDGTGAAEGMAFCCTDGAVAERIWDWRRFRFIDTAPWAEALHGELLAIFGDDPEVELLGSGPDFPGSGP